MKNLMRFNAVVCAVCTILMSPGLGCYEALAAMGASRGAGSPGLVRIGAMNIFPGNTLPGASNINMDARVSGLGAVEAGGRASRGPLGMALAHGGAVEDFLNKGPLLPRTQTETGQAVLRAGAQAPAGQQGRTISAASNSRSELGAQSAKAAGALSRKAAAIAEQGRQWAVTAKTAASSRFANAMNALNELFLGRAPRLAYAYTGYGNNTRGLQGPRPLILMRADDGARSAPRAEPPIPVEIVSPAGPSSWAMTRDQNPETGGKLGGEKGSTNTKLLVVGLGVTGVLIGLVLAAITVVMMGV